MFEPCAGVEMVTMGTVLGATETVISAAPASPTLSMACAVMMWLPTDSVVVENVPPAPMLPSRLHHHPRSEHYF